MISKGTRVRVPVNGQPADGVVDTVGPDPAPGREREYIVKLDGAGSLAIRPERQVTEIPALSREIERARERAAQAATVLGDALAAARNIRDRAEAAASRGLRDDDLDYLKRQSVLLAAADVAASVMDSVSAVGDLAWESWEQAAAEESS